jgi:nucleoside-diphosphate-sugar epimerase
VIADLTTPSSLAALERPFDWVVNCAAASGGGEADYRRLYLEGTRNLLNWLAGSSLRRYVYTSSTGVYGQTDGAEVTENSAADPGTPTGQVLVETEQELRRAAEARGFPAIILRLAGIYGPGRAYWLRQFLSGEARLEGEGRRFLNMIHRDDVVGAINAALEQGRIGDTYNVVDNHPVLQIEVFRWLASRLGRPMPPSVPEDAIVARRRGVTNKRVSNRKLQAELGWQLTYPSFREGYEAELARMEKDRPRP